MQSRKASTRVKMPFISSARVYSPRGDSAEAVAGACGVAVEVELFAAAAAFVRTIAGSACRTFNTHLKSAPPSSAAQELTYLEASLLMLSPVVVVLL